MESTCVDIPRKKRTSRNKQPGEDSPDDSPPEVTTAILFEDDTVQAPTVAPTVAPTPDKAWKDTFAELFADASSAANTGSTNTESVPATPSSNNFFQPQSSLLFSDLLSSDADTTKTFQSAGYLNSDGSLYNSLKKDYQELKEQMDDVRQSNIVLEDRLNSVTQEVTEMRHKMQQMLNLLVGFYTPQTNSKIM